MNKQARFLAVAVLAVAVTAAATSSPARGQELDGAANETVFLLKRALTTRTPAERDRLLQALRRLRDPQAGPIYRYLTEMSDPFRQAHGIMGMAEIGASSGLTVDAIAMLDDPRAQFEMVRASIADEMINLDQAIQWVSSSKLTVGARLELARLILKEGRSVDAAFLREAASSEDVRQRTYAQVLLVQAGESSALEPLRALANSSEPESQGLCVDALNVAAESNFGQLAGWALEVSQNPHIDSRISQPAMGIALRLRAPGAQQSWRQAYREATDSAQQMRLAMFALYSAPWVDATVFDTLLASDDEVIQAIGRAGQAVATQRGVDQAILALVQYHHLPLNRWALGYAHEHAALEDARAILLGLILAFDDKQRLPNLDRHLEIAVRAAQVLYDRDPDGAVPLLRRVITATKNEPMFVRRLLTALLDCQSPGTHRVVVGLPPFQDRSARLIALVMLSHSEEPLSEDQMHEMALLVRGGGGMREDVRLQVGWRYLHRTGQLQQAINQLLR